MKVILCEDVDNLGPMGETVNVNAGYARNFLLPRKLAVLAESASAKRIEHEMRIIGKREAKQRETYIGKLKEFEGIIVELTSKAGEEGKLYGSITSLHIAARLEEMGYEVDRKKLQLKEPIKTLGEHVVRLRLMKDVETDIGIRVSAADAVEEPLVEHPPEPEDGVDTMAEAGAETEAAAEETPAEAADPGETST